MGGLGRSKRLFAQHTGRRIAPIGLQLYTVRADLARDFEGTLEQVAGIGFREVELAGDFGRSPQSLRALLDRLGLVAPAAHLRAVALRDSLPQAIEGALALGHQYLVLSYLAPDERRSLDDYRRVIELLDRSAATCRAHGLVLAYHNHDFELTPLEGEVPYQLLLRETDPDLVRFEMDLYWLSKAGGDPLEYFREYPKRFPLVHVKDMDKTPARGFTEVGNGVIDFARIFAHSELAGIEHYLIEQDTTPGPALDSVRASYRYLAGLEIE
jgi:sugar phosphate isomerase/epimerase